MLNRWMGIGNLGKDPETRYTTGERSTAMCRFTMAVDHGYGERKKTVWMNVVAFGKLAENCQKFLRKGKKVYVDGEIDIKEYQKQDGSKGYATEVTARTVEFLSNQEQVERNQAAVNPAWSSPQWGGGHAPEGFEQMARQEEIPF